MLVVAPIMASSFSIEEGAVKKDAEVQLLLRERRKGHTQALAAARAGMSERTARKYEQGGVLPSALTRPRTHRTRPNPFAEDWPWIVSQLERDGALQAKTLFALAQERHPGRYRDGQVRTLQRHIASWRALHGPEREVLFAQCHVPGEAAQSDFTHMSSLDITLGGVPFPHLLYHVVLTYSNVEAVSVCFAESFEALAEGLERGLWQLGGVPRTHRTDHLGAAIHPLDAAGRQDFRARYLALMAHYRLEPTTNNTGVAHENGDVEQAHYRFKEAVDQALRVRGHRDFADRAAYERFLHDLVSRRNQTRAPRFTVERQALRPLPAAPLAPCREVRVTVSRFSTIVVLGNTYSVPSRLIGTALTVRVRAESLETYVGTTLTCTLPRVQGRHQHAINYRHVIWSLVRKPGAFAAYRYRDDLFPSLTFRRAYDVLCTARPCQADRDYVRLLYLAASTAESEVDTALALLLDAGVAPTFDAVRDLVRLPQATALPVLGTPVLDLAAYDRLLPSRCAHVPA
jgi:transcriptional regulator with XRE-family HTH domain